MTSIKWQTNHRSERQLQLRKSLDALSAPTRRKPNISNIARVACGNCPFRRSNCEINTFNDNPYGHLAVILTKGSFPNFPDVAANRQNLRKNLDDPAINVDKVSCADLLRPPSAIKNKYLRTSELAELAEPAEPTLHIDETAHERTWKVPIDFPVVASFDHKPTDAEIDEAFEKYSNRLSQ